MRKLPRRFAPVRAWLGPWAFGLSSIAAGSLTGADRAAFAQDVPAETASQQAETPSRYPFDPICPWGRVADGQGLLVRCLERAESVELAKVSDPTPEEVSRSDEPSPEMLAANQLIEFDSVGEAEPDTGSLPEARPQLSKPKQRYVQCARENGGLRRARASVTVRFLVRERGRAEGVSVKAHEGMSLEAAKCIADVVDRRYVGFPEAPIVGATMQFWLRAEPAGR